CAPRCAATPSPDAAAARLVCPVFCPWWTVADHNARNARDRASLPRSHDPPEPNRANAPDDPVGRRACGGSSSFALARAAIRLIRPTMVVWKRLSSSAAADPAYVPGPRSASRLRSVAASSRSVPRAISRCRGSAARSRAPPSAGFQRVALMDAGDAKPPNIYTARFFRQRPGPSCRFLKIYVTRLLQGLNCYEFSEFFGAVSHSKDLRILRSVRRRSYCLSRDRSANLSATSETARS